MTAATDTFVAFVDVLADALDDHDTTGDGLASRLCLSRYHFDRVIASVAGEPPATFRRRILLERAAYRLLTTKRSVLDVAVEAGYGSHEAFTRAFARAYGLRPTTWRRHPTRIQIETPSDVHFHPPGGLRLPARSREAPMNLLLRMVEHHVWLTGEMVDRSPARRGPRPADRRLGRRRGRRSDDALAAVAAGRPDGDVERGARDARLRLVRGASRDDRVDATPSGHRRAKGRRSSNTCGECPRRAGWTRRSSMPSASRPRSSPTAG
jgi:AraC-like DNA-binding protein